MRDRGSTWMVAWLLCLGPAYPLTAGALSAAEAETLTAAARATPRDARPQAVIDLLMRQGRAADLDALDHVLALGHVDMVRTYAGAFRSGNRGRPAPAIEERLLRRYDQPAIAWALFAALDRYENPLLADRIVEDLARLASLRRDRARRCRIVVRDAVSGSPLASSSASFGVAQSTHRGLQCDPGTEATPSALAARLEAALLLAGNTTLPGMAQRIAPHLRDLGRMPPVEPAAWDSADAFGLGGTIHSLDSVARLMGEQVYRAAGEDLVAILGQLDGRARDEFTAAWPLLQALGRMDLQQGSRAIARWIELRSTSTFPSEDSPELARMIGLLGPVLPEGQIELAALRERVAANLPAAARAPVNEVFARVEAANRGLREPSPEALVAWARAGNGRLVRYVLARGVPIDARDSRGDTALTAAIPNEFAMQKLLVEAGASADLPGRGGLTPLHLAVEHFVASAEQPFLALDFYLAQGANVNAQTPEGTTLHTAISRSPDLVRYLVAHGADLEARNRYRITPLHLAVAQARLDSALALLEGGANVNAEMADGIGDGLTPLQIARDRKDASMEALLGRYGAKVNLAYAAKRAAANAVLFPLFAPLLWQR